MILADILPRRNKYGRLLFTTRTATIADSCTTSDQSLTIALQPPGNDDAVAMLAVGAEMGGRSTDEASNADLERIVQLVGNLALAIDQAASYIKGCASSTKEFLALYNSEEIMEVLSWENDLSRHEEKSVVATFMPALNKISQTAPDALILLRILSFCDPENIPISILKQGCRDLHPARKEAVPVRRTRWWKWRSRKKPENMRDVPVASAANELEAIVDLFRSSTRLNKAIQEIQRLSLAVYTLEGSERIIRIHDLVQFLLRSKLIAATERERWLEMVICIVCKAFEEIGDLQSPRNWGRCDQFVSHVEFMEGFAAQYGLLNATLLDASTMVALYVSECGLYQKAADMLKRTWDQQKALLGEEHPDTLFSMSCLAAAYGRQGYWNKAEELGIKVTEITKRVLGEEHPDTLASIANLALNYRDQGHYKRAEKLVMKVMETKKRVLGEEHSDTLACIASLAINYHHQGHYKKAEKLGMEVMETNKRVLGEEHSYTLISMNNLALTYLSQERWEEAENLQIKVLETRQRLLGEKHPHTLISMSNLAMTYRNQERWKEAESLELKILETRQRVLGEMHPNTLISMANLATIYWIQERYEEAESLEVEVLETRQRVLGEEHPKTLISMENLAFTWKAQGQNVKAIELLEQCVHLRIQILGADHPDTVSSSEALAEWQRESFETGAALHTSLETSGNR